MPNFTEGLTGVEGYYNPTLEPYGGSALAALLALAGGGIGLSAAGGIAGLTSAMPGLTRLATQASQSPTMQSFKEAIQPGMRQRTFPGPYQGPIEAGRNVAAFSENRPVHALPENATELAKLLKELGGEYLR